MDKIHAKLMTFTPSPYELEWNSHPQTPIRFRINTTKEQSEVYNFLWIEAITKITGRRHSESEKCINFTIPWEATNIHISIFPSTGTVMFQGKAAPYWADEYMEKIHSYITRDEKGYLKPASCVVCQQEGDNEMLVCDKSMCGNWTHLKCACLTEESATSNMYWCIKCQNEPSERQLQSVSAGIPNNSITSTPYKNNKTSHSTSMSTNSSEGSRQSYLKDLHSKLEDISKDLSYNEDSLGTSEFCNILQTLKDNITVELEESSQHCAPEEDSLSREINSPEIMSNLPDDPIPFTQIVPYNLSLRSETNSPDSDKDASVQNRVLPSENSKFQSLDTDKSTDLIESNVLPVQTHESCTQPSPISNQKEKSQLNSKEEKTHDKSLQTDQTTNDRPQSTDSPKNSTSVHSSNTSNSPSSDKQTSEHEKQAVTPNLLSNKTETKNMSLNYQDHVGQLKKLLNEKDIEMKTYIEKIKNLEDLLDVQSPAKNGKHRLEFRSQQNIIKEYSLLEERNKRLQTQLNAATSQKREYQTKVLNFESEKFAYEKEIKFLKFQKNAADDKILHLINEKDKALNELNTLKTVQTESLSTKYKNENLQNIIQNLEDQNAIDDGIKRNLNDLLEIAYGDIRDLKDQLEKQSTLYNKAKDTMINQLKNHANESQENINLVNEMEAIDLTLENRSRAAVQNIATDNIQPPKTNNQQETRQLILDDKQQQYLQNYRQSIQNSVHHPNFVQKNANNPRTQPPADNIYNQNAQDPRQDPQLRVQRNTGQNSVVNEYNLKGNLNPDYNQHLIMSRQHLQSRFSAPLNHQRRQRNQVDYYDFAKKDSNTLRTKGRPICPWFLKNKCFSDVCIYHHPSNKENLQQSNSLTLDDISDTKSNYDSPPICTYHLQKRCWFGEHCKNLHPQL